MSKVMERKPKQTVLAGLLGAHGRRIADVRRASGMALSWNGIHGIVHGLIDDPDPATLRLLTKALNKVLGTTFTDAQVMARSRVTVTTDSALIERGLRGGWTEAE